MTALELLDPHARWAALALVRLMKDGAGSESADDQAAMRGLEVALGFPDAITGGAASFPDDLALNRLGPRDRLLAFAACAWMMFADGISERRESDFLDGLADELQIAPRAARFLVAHARWVRSEYELPPHREADLLLTECARRVAALEARAAA